MSNKKIKEIDNDKKRENMSSYLLTAKINIIRAEHQTRKNQIEVLQVSMSPLLRMQVLK